MTPRARRLRHRARNRGRDVALAVAMLAAACVMSAAMVLGMLQLGGVAAEAIPPLAWSIAP